MPSDSLRPVRSLLGTLFLPALLLAFFLAAPAWYAGKVHALLRHNVVANDRLTDLQKQKRTEVFDSLDVQNIASDSPPAHWIKLHQYFVAHGIVSDFARLWWGLVFSILLFAILGFALTALVCLRARARKSQARLITSYRLASRIATTTAVLKLALLIPLLAYGAFEFTVLLADRYSPQFILALVLGGVVSLVTCLIVLLRKVPLQFTEPLSREIPPEDAPELWQAVHAAGARLGTTPPDRLVVGLKLNFYVTELDVLTDTGLVQGRTLYLSQPLLRQFSEAELLAIIGHELGHFRGDDTRLTREFYPLRFKVAHTLAALHRAGLPGWPSIGLLNFLTLCFEPTIQATSRVRELLADQCGASLTSGETLAHALVKLQVFNEVFQRLVAQDPAINPLQTEWRNQIAEKIPATDPFWDHLFEKTLPHPLDSHPPLQTRLEALGMNIVSINPRAIAQEETASAYAAWFAGRDALFDDLLQKADAALDTVRINLQLAQADYTTQKGKELLDRHFPEIRWRRQPLAVWILLAAFTVCVVACAAGAMALIAKPEAFIALATLAFVFAGFAAWVWITRNDQWILNAGGIRDPGWIRSLRFTNVEGIRIVRINSRRTVIFLLKQKQPSLAVWSLPGSRTIQTIRLRGGLTEKPEVIAQTIHRYYTRQPEPVLPTPSRPIPKSFPPPSLKPSRLAPPRPGFSPNRPK